MRASERCCAPKPGRLTPQRRLHADWAADFALDQAPVHSQIWLRPVFMTNDNLDPPDANRSKCLLSVISRFWRGPTALSQGILGQVQAWIHVLLLVALLAAVLAGLWAFARARLSARIYARRLEAVAADYERLRQDYNRAVSRTAVTELRVKGTNVTIVVRTADGVTREFPTSCRADREVYVDYVVLGGRLWIRRAFDAATAPESGTLVDPALAGVRWDADSSAVGKAVYRRLDEGRWVVTVSGNGSLGLERARDDAEIALSPPPPVLDFAAIEREVQNAQRDISWGDLLRALLSSGADHH